MNDRAGVAWGTRTPVRGALDEHTRDLLALLVDSVTDYAIFALDVNGHVATWNAGAQRLKGYTANEIIGSHFSQFYTEEDLAAGEPERELAIAVADGHYEDEGWRLRRDGTLFWASVVITALRGPDGRLIGFGKVTRDLTERRRGEELLRNSEERFRLLVNSVSDYAIFLLDPDGTVSSWNLGAEKLKGYRADEILGRHFSRFYTQEDVRDGRPAAALQTALECGRFESEGWRVRKDGTRFWARVVITALRGADGEHRGFAKVTNDLTDRKRNEDALRGVLSRERETAAQLRDLDRMRGDVVGLIAHDLRAPLGVIQSLVHLLTTDWDTLDTDDKLAYLARIDARAVTMSGLVDDVSDMARIDAGQLEIERAPFDLGDVARRAVHDVVALPTTRTVTTDIEADARAVGDARRTWQVIANLLSNALKFSPASEPIEVAVRRQRHDIVTSVRDHGRGIPADLHHLLFQRFTRLDTSAGIPGSGIGLYIAKTLVESQGGSMWVESTPHVGSTFHFRLPAAT